MLDNCFFVDIHCHLAKPSVGMYGKLGQSPDELIERMNENGVDYTVVFSMVNNAGLTPDELSRANDYVIEAIKKFPDRLIGFCLTTPRHGEHALKEINRCLNAGLQGIKLHPHLLGYFPIDSALLDPIMQEARSHSLPVLTHSDVNSKRCSPFQVAILADKYPEVPVIMAHWGMDSDYVHFAPQLVKNRKNLFLDTSCTPNLPEFIFSRPSYEIPDQVLFGSDGPTLAIEVEIAKLRVAEKRYGMDPIGKKKILGKNAARILGIVPNS